MLPANLDAKADPLLATAPAGLLRSPRSYNMPDVLAVFRAAGVNDFGMKPPPPLPPSGMGTVTVPVVNVQGLKSWLAYIGILVVSAGFMVYGLSDFIHELNLGRSAW